jgi:hypothetical protein
MSVMAYRASCTHGKVRVLMVDEPQFAKDNAKEIASCIKGGLTIDRVTVEEARKSDMNCPECDAAFSAKKKRKATSEQKEIGA